MGGEGWGRMGEGGRDGEREDGGGRDGEREEEEVKCGHSALSALWVVFHFF